MVLVRNTTSRSSLLEEHWGMDLQWSSVEGRKPICTSPSGPLINESATHMDVKVRYSGCDFEDIVLRKLFSIVVI